MPTAAPPQLLLSTAVQYSRFLGRLVERPPACFDPAHLAVPLAAAEIRSMLQACAVADEAGLLHALREVRKAAVMRIMTRDLNGLADLAEVVGSVTALAEECVRFALGYLHDSLADSHGYPHATGADSPQSLLVVGMGKLGGEELNVSSDIDLIFLYPDEGETRGSRPVSAHEYFTRLGRKLINALSSYTADGYVFRVDMRLRPYGESGPLVMSFPMLENYLLSQGREWERYAWVKAREITGQPDGELMALVTPFVYRRHLDYSAFASLRELHAQIRAEVGRRELHDNIKLGPGGIREIEFVAQVFQIVRGGRDADLRLRPTLATLARLAQRQLLPQEAAAELREAYVFLRNLEHRLQYLEDQQTQMLPAGSEDRTLIAHSMGFADFDSFYTVLERHRTSVTRHFDTVFADPQAQRSEHPLAGVWRGADDETALAQLAAAGYANGTEILRRVAELRQGALYRRMSASTQARVDRLVPRLLEIAAEFERPDATLERLARVLESIGRRESYLALLLEYPAVLHRLATLASASPWAADFLALHPILLDELIGPAHLEPPDWGALAASLSEELDTAGSMERQMDVVRHFKQVRTMHLLMQDLAGTLPLEKLSDHLSDLADLVLAQVLRLAWSGLRTRHRDTPAFAIVGYGKLGGKELGYASDLDLIFLHDDEHRDAQENYARLAQRINTWLTSFTPAGVLYDTDLRLRPDGASGLLVSRLEAFAEYQRTKAWVWEHQALTRARFVAGDAEIGQRFERLRTGILCMPRELSALRAEVASMRQRMLEGHPNRSGLFDIKHDRGGIVDVEFIVQYLVLGHAHAHAQLTANKGNLALLRMSAELGLIERDAAEAVHHSYREFRRMQHALRLQGEAYARVEPEKVEELVRPVLGLWESVFDGSTDGERLEARG
jgi:glutamate-ammonia-ligase adenylyltransferase